ncbi:ABC transporter substrate-binding protein [Sediminispirochaeta bajacaliforniensis]|uniref:ABC transporter substrate-binding protein n=1 Tax=Sediminispirochaeta bajacaliforniensis TaxID=148 RepID=UPI0003729A5F|nr:ABC transporter substrate-binding protein [Sediminispirochaeta bajacaliforniensis]
MKKRVMLFLTATILGTALLLSCGGRSAEKSDGEGKAESTHLTMYCALPETEIPSYLEAFKEDTGITVDFVRLSAGEVLSKVQVEKNNPQASIWYGGNCDTFIAAAANDLLEPYKSSELINIPASYQDPDGYWSPVYVGALAFAVNKEWFADHSLSYPTSWNDLLDPQYKDQISMAHPGSSGTAYTILATMVQMLGEEEAMAYMKELDKNIRQYTKSGSAPPKNVGLGEASIGLAFSHDCLKPAVQGYPVETVFPKDGTGYEIGAIAIIKNGPKEEHENAKKFIDWVLSERAQDIYSQNSSFRLPVNMHAQVPSGAISIDKLPIIEYDFIWAGENRKRLIEKFSDVVSNANNLK